MTPAEKGFLLLGSKLADPWRKPLTTAQMRVLAQRVEQAQRVCEDRELRAEDLLALGYSEAYAQHILYLLSQEDQLQRYLRGGQMAQCQPLTRISDGYPRILAQRLGLESPSVLWAKGNIALLNTNKIAVVGCRDIRMENATFAQEVGRQAAIQGYTLVSGNARGADKLAQRSCIKHGGSVICVVADALTGQKAHERVLYLSEEDYDAEFSAQRALSRNRIIHALGEKTFVAQCDLERGGTWHGTANNLRHGWSPVFCFADGSDAVLQLQQRGAQMIDLALVNNFDALTSQFHSLFE